VLTIGLLVSWILALFSFLGSVSVRLVPEGAPNKRGSYKKKDESGK